MYHVVAAPSKREPLLGYFPAGHLPKHVPKESPTFTSSAPFLILQYYKEVNPCHFSKKADSFGHVSEGGL